MAWANIAAVTALTGVTVDAVTLKLGVSAIELYTGLIEEVPRPDVSGRDLYWLKCAVGYQAAWISAQPDYLERASVSGASQDGQSATGANPDWLTLSPLARKAVKRLSWRGVRSIVPDNRAGRHGRLDPLSDASDDHLSWQPS